MQDIDKLEKGIEAIQELVKVGESVMKDGKVDVKDLAHLPALFEAGSKAVTAFKEGKEMLEEIKDIDGAEAIKLITKLYS